MFYVPGDFICKADNLEQRVIRRFNSIIERTHNQSSSKQKTKNNSNRIKTIELSHDRTKRCSLQPRVTKKVELPLIEEKRFLLRGSIAQHTPIKKMSLRRLELQNKMTIPHHHYSKVEGEKRRIQKQSVRMRSDYFSIVPWQYGEEVELRGLSIIQ